MVFQAKDEKITLDALGHVRCAAKYYQDVPSEGLPAVLEMKEWVVPALEGLHTGDYIYVIVLLHEADPNELKGSPGTEHQRGAFALRSSDRPNRIGMTLTKIEQIEGGKIAVSWLDFSDGSPILDIKRYSNRWECIFSAPGDDRRFIERQLPRDTLAEVLARPIRNYAGNIPEAETLAAIGAELTQVHNIFLHDPELKVHVMGSKTLIDAVQGLTKASFGNQRLSIDNDTTSTYGGQILFYLREDSWLAEIMPTGYSLRHIIQ